MDLSLIDFVSDLILYSSGMVSAIYMEKVLEIIGVDWLNRLNAGQIFYTCNILGKKNTCEIIHQLFN